MHTGNRAGTLAIESIAESARTMAERLVLSLAELGLLADVLVRFGIRRLLKQRLQSLPRANSADAKSYLTDFLNEMNASPIALLPDKANQQHYELPPEFFEQVLGRRLKYSCCHWPEGVEGLDEAENQALAETCRRAELSDGQDILELGCGWGSLSLWMAREYSQSRIVAVSNSLSQGAYLRERAARAGIDNIEVVTADMNAFQTDRRFDRIVSVEMFEHMRNWSRLFDHVATWLKPEGRFFLHVFCHRSLPYRFEVSNDIDWMSRYFFSGGMMPSFDLPRLVSSTLRLERQWQWSGNDYRATANAWLANMDRRKRAIWPILRATYGAKAAPLWWTRWRIFFMACAELFGYSDGEEWLVGHCLFRRADRPTQAGEP